MPASKQYFREYYANRRAEYVQLLGGHCVVCGTKEELEFDHVEPVNKKFEIAKLMNYSKEVVLAELSKCQLLCRECHLEKTKREGSLTKGENRHGTGKLPNCLCALCKVARASPYPLDSNGFRHGSSGYRKGCRCEICKEYSRRNQKIK